jgi:hypothetical protein
MKLWNVFLRGEHIDTVFFQKAYDAEYVRIALIEHDGFDPEITVSGAA